MTAPLTFAAKREMILAQAKRGVTPSLIAHNLKLDHGYVRSVVSRARMRDATIPNFPQKAGRRLPLIVGLTPQFRRQLAIEAKRRGIRVPTLVTRVITAALEDGLLAALLEEA